MEIPAALQTLIDSARTDPTSLLKHMKPGQLLHARVAMATNESLAKLVVGNTELVAKTQVPLVKDELLLLRVEKGLPQLELKIVPSEAKTLEAELKQAAHNVLRSAMGKQMPPKEVQQLLRQVLTPQTQPPTRPQVQGQLQSPIQTQAQPQTTTQAQLQTTAQSQTQPQAQLQTTAQPQTQPQAQLQTTAQPQAQPQAQLQTTAQPQAQPQAQLQTTAQPQTQAQAQLQATAQPQTQPQAQLQTTAAQPQAQAQLQTAAQPQAQLQTPTLPQTQLQNPTQQQTQLQAQLQTTVQPQTQLQAQNLPAVQQIVKVLSPQAPPVDQVNANAVRHLLQHSGIFFEPNLIQGNVLPQDQKFQLLQLLRLFTPQARAAQRSRATSGQADAKAEARQTNVDTLMNRLLRLVEGSLSRIQSHQAASLNREEPNTQIWQFDMPLQVANKQENLQLRIQQEENEHESSADGKIWKVDIDFDFDNLGEIRSRINLSNEDVSAAFWCHEETTTNLIASHIPKLENALKEAGLQVKAISSLTGEPPASHTIRESLLDERV